MTAAMSTASIASPRRGRRYADSMRPGPASMSAVVVPLVHRRPKLVGCVFRPEDFAAFRRPVSGSVMMSRTRPQPTPQYAQSVSTLVVVS